MAITVAKSTDISSLMRELIERLETNGFNGVDVPIKPECEDEWGIDYAIVQGYYYDAIFADDCEYQIRIGFEKFVVDHFKAVAFSEQVSKNKDFKKLKHGQIVVCFHRTSQEIEVYRKGHILINNEEFLECKDGIMKLFNQLKNPDFKNWKAVPRQIDKIFGR